MVHVSDEPQVRMSRNATTTKTIIQIHFA